MDIEQDMVTQTILQLGTTGLAIAILVALAMILRLK